MEVAICALKQPSTRKYQNYLRLVKIFLQRMDVKRFYFRATLGEKEVLQLSKNSLKSFFMLFDSISLPHSKKVF